MRKILVLVLCGLTAQAISPHRLSLKRVLERAEWIGQIRVLSIRSVTGDHGSGVNFEIEPLSTLKGQPPPTVLHYWEGWPRQSPDGKQKAPIWTGSGLERKVEPGQTVFALSSGSSLLRMEETLP